MTGPTARRDLVLGVSPCGEPQARLAAAVSRAGGLGVLDLAGGDRRARRALELTARWAPGAFGVRVRPGCALVPDDLEQALVGTSARVDTVLLGAIVEESSPWDPAALAGHYRVLAEVTSRDEALAAAAAGAHGLVVRGNESGGRVGELSSFVLLQQVLALEHLSLPVWVAGGIGLRTAAASVVGGAAGVVLDSQLALLAESELPADVAAAIHTMDGSETVLVDGHRLLPRRAGARTPRLDPLPVGQDGFLAARFAERFGDVGTTVRAVRDAILDAARDAGTPQTALRPGSSFATAHGIGLPVVQGPMTRVSDQPGFAGAVAGAGGLPFLALALSDEASTRALLTETRAELGERPWGVGILGFAPEETRTAQLRVIEEVRPTCAIIAGGRPAQAKALEDAGITTYLHVPSPGLLEQFVRSGARKFVFEGSECGGHVGPRASFPLWEAQLGVLDDFLAGEPDAAQELQLLFAGGIHDARSAAMVATMAAPLAARGVRVGVLMGTAYLFTAEAVRYGAIQPAFQQQVLQAERTDLLETAPGHATRGVASAFTASFQQRKAELTAEGLPDREVWERLEQLNVGRLRIASKGLRRDGATLVPVDPDGQVTDGLFMAGQVAALRSEVTGVKDLHRAATTGAAEFHAARTERLRRELRIEEPAAGIEPPPPVDVAIVGMACVFPRSPDLADFWATVLSGADAVTEVPADRWDVDTYYGESGDRTPSKWGGFLPPVPFDPLAYGIPPAALASIEPTQLLALEVARRALADAGYAGPGHQHDRTSVVFGAEAGSDLSNAGVLRTLLPAYLGELPPALDEQLPRLTEDSFPGVLANVIAGRIANRLDLGGANYTVDAACASSLAAVDVACKELTNGTSDLVLCGGADLHNGINDYLMFSAVHALSPTGRSRTFDSTADGIALGEGVACVVLKRLADAERDGDRIYAVIKGVGSASDGKALGLTAPRPDGQRRALERAYANARIAPSEVGLVEAHGTGTVVGDRTELQTLTAVFTEAGAAPGRCALGSVKSQIGHTKCAAGLAGLIKAAMAVYAGVKPPTIHLDNPNPAWDSDTSPFAFHTESRPWPAPPAERIAGVSAFGFGGTNFHVVLRAYDGGTEPRHGQATWPAELFCFRGADRRAAHSGVQALLDLLAANDASGRPWRLRDLAHTTSRRFDARDERVQVAVVVDDLDHLAELLRRALAGEHDPVAGLFQPQPPSPEHGAIEAAGEVAFLFPGQGSQRPGMLADLFVAFPELQHYLRLHRREWADLLYPPAAFDPERARAQEDRVRDTRVAQPVLGITGLAVEHLLDRLGVRPDLAAGHSYGELVALCSAGAFDPRTLLTLSEERAGAILAAAGDDPGAMAAVSATLDEVVGVLQTAGLSGDVVPANQNAPRQVVVSGPTERVEDAVRALRDAGLAAKRIPVACAFHSPVVAGATTTFGAVLADLPLRAPEIPVWSNRTAAPYGASVADVRAELAAQVGAPVRFVDQIEAMYASGARVFVEAGPGRVLSRLVDAILGDRPHVTVAFDAVSIQPVTGTARPGPPPPRTTTRPGTGLRSFLAGVAQLAVAGVPLRTGWLFEGRDARDVSGRTPPAQPGWTVDGQLVRTRDGAYIPGGLTPARRVPEAMLTRLDPMGAASTGAGVPGAGVSGAGVSGDRDALLAEYLRTSREMVAAQRDVLLAYLGTPPAGQLVWQPGPGTAATLPANGGVVAEAAPVVPMPTASAPAVPTPAADAEPSGHETSRTPASPAAAADLAAMVLQIISERTGYPTDMIELDLDLEADLSIDSIKRTEIAGEIVLRLGAGNQLAGQLDDSELEDLAKARTARTIADWLTSRFETPESTGGTPEGTEELQPASGVPPKRLVPQRVALQAASLPPEQTLAGAAFTVVGGETAAAGEVTALLQSYGAIVRGGDTEPVDGVIHLGGLVPTDEWLLPELFGDLQTTLRQPPRWLLAASASGLERPAGLRGLFRTIAREYPQITAKAVEVDASAPPTEVARMLVDELLAGDQAPVVARAGGARYGFEPVGAALGGLASTGAGPAGDGTAEAQALGLDRDAVVVLFGGARGITAQVAAAFATASRCRLELVGRTPLPADAEEPELAAATDRTALRAALIARGLRTPAEIERTADQILAGREVAATLAELSTLGSRARYHAVDVRDSEAVHQLIKEIQTEHGRLDGVVYAAGVIEDRLLVEKDAESFRRVFGTKVDGARSVLAALEELPNLPGFAVLFGSIAGVLGNRGQSDYAAANDALEVLGEQWSARTGARCLTVHWGPWAPAARHSGMVTPELRQEYARRGIELIDPEEGTLSLLRELAWGEPSTSAVVYTASGW
ncbi:type I polyketide synthase [Actinopolymorpha alba]|uniref:type I polyketide synthase n=1 Tax=Actinopolymorpha alba TaxID=533267 RepID=UPI00037321D1|nr:type I polyketide synthase [Actinopolymorpha alba]